MYCHSFRGAHILIRRLARHQLEPARIANRGGAFPEPVAFVKGLRDCQVQMPRPAIRVELLVPRGAQNHCRIHPINHVLPLAAARYDRSDVLKSARMASKQDGYKSAHRATAFPAL